MKGTTKEEMMIQKLGIGLGVLICGLLVWNVLTIQRLESRIVLLEAEAGFAGDEVPEKRPTKQENKTTSETPDQLTAREQNGTLKAASRSNQLATSGRSNRSATDSYKIKKTVGSAILELDEPEVKAAFDAYLNQYMKNWKDNQKSDGLSNFLDHMATSTEVFCEESGLAEDIREQIIQEIETAHDVWIANDVALESGEIDRREYQETDKKIGEKLKSDMTELIGKEAWEKLSTRIWNY